MALRKSLFSLVEVLKVNFSFLINSYSDLIKMRFALIYVGFMIFINHVKKVITKPSLGLYVNFLGLRVKKMITEYDMQTK